MKLRYSGNIMPFEDSMKKVSALTWASSGKKLAVGAADRVNLLLFSLFICSIKTVSKKINFPQSLQTKDRSHIWLEDYNFLLIHRKLQLLKVITLYLFTKSDQIGDKKKPSVTNSQSVLLWLVWCGPRTILTSYCLVCLMEKLGLEC